MSGDEGEDTRGNPSPDQSSWSTPPPAPGASNPTPFIYPIRSLLSTIQPVPDQPTSPTNQSTIDHLAASLKREVASRRAAALGVGPSGSNPHTASSTKTPDSTTEGSKSIEKLPGTSTVTFPSNFPLTFNTGDFITLSSIAPSMQPATSRPISPQVKLPETTGSGDPDSSVPPGPEMRVRDFGMEEASGSSMSGGAGSPGRSSFASLVRLPPVPSAGEEDVSFQSRSTPYNSSNVPSAQSEAPRPHEADAELRAGPPVTIRLKYSQDENGHHHVVGREGVLTRCEDEPIRTPGAIQSYGVLIVVEEDLEEGLLIIRQVSENVQRIMGLSIPYLFSLECFTDILPFDQAEILWKQISFLDDPNLVAGDGDSTTSENASQQGGPPLAREQNKSQPKKGIEGPDVFSLVGWSEPDQDDLDQRISWQCWCAAHRPVTSEAAPGPPLARADPPTSHSAMKEQTDLNSDAAATASESGLGAESRRLIVLEFELEHDDDNPIYTRYDMQDEPATDGSRTSFKTGASSENARRPGDSSGSGQPSTGSSAQTATLSQAENGTSTETLSNPTPLTNAALQALDERTAPETGSRFRYDLPSAGQEFLGLDTSTPPIAQQSSGSVASAPLTNNVDSVSSHIIRGDPAWYPSMDEIHDSTVSRSKPIKALERMRMLARGFGARQSPAFRRLAGTGGTRADGEASGSGGSSPAGTPAPSQRSSFRNRGGASSMLPATQNVGTMDVFAVLSEVIEQLGVPSDLDTFLRTTVGVIKDLTQFHRVLIYQFDDTWNGQVVAELVDWSASHDLFKGMHFPATDIPPQARELYLINKVRTLYDRDQATSRIVCRDWSDLDQPLDMTHCYLRAMSPIHVKYLGNMGVRASMSISITAFGKLWGLIACHSYGNNGMRVSFPVRQMLRLLSDSISRNIERLSYSQRLHTRKLISTLPTEDHPHGFIVSDAEDLLTLFDADYGVLVIGDGAKILGLSEQGREILVIAQYLRLKGFTLMQASQSILQDYPDLVLPSGVDVISGLLYVPLSSGGKDFIAFLRKGQVKDVVWAGRPHKAGEEGRSNLEPRKSFKAWAQTVVGKCRSWTDEQIETAGVLALVYGKFIEVWRQKENALRTTQLASLLLTNASHEVRTPLNHIIGFLELALEGNLDEETRTNLEHTHKASKSLLFVINDLLDLTKLESGRTTTFNDPFDLHNLIREAVAPYEKDAARKGIEFNVVTAGSPQLVLGDSRKIASVISNLTANAVKYTDSGSVTVECRPFAEPEGLRDRANTATTHQMALEIVVSDTGCGIPTDKLEVLFRQFEQVEPLDGNGAKPAGLGLGLAVVARIAEQLRGQLRVDSGPEGSRFSFLLPFTLPDPSTSGPNLAVSSSRSASQTSVSEVDDFVSAMSASHISRDQPARGSPTASVLQRERHTGGNGVFYVQDSKTGIRGVKIDEFSLDKEPRLPVPKPLSPAIETADPLKQPQIMVSDARPEGQLRVMVVEDDRVNSALLCKRLKNWGHMTVAALNGQEAKDLIEKDYDFDCVMMDLQMPILDGYQATTAIRNFEAGERPPLVLKSHLMNGRIPIFAVSASLSEPQQPDLWDLGLDGWLLKPINWSRLRELINGTTDLDQRRKDLYTPGQTQWEKGGWLGWYEGNGPV